MLLQCWRSRRGHTLAVVTTLPGGGHKQWARTGQWLMHTSYPRAWSACSQPHSGCPYAICHLSVLADVLRFDNTYSLLHTKKVGYTAEVLLPDKACEEKLQGFVSTGPPQDSEDSGHL